MGRIIQGDALEVLKTLGTNTVDSICSDPPSSINFMGMEWDNNKGGRNQWIAWLAEILREAMRVLKPGGHAFIWALPKTSHYTAMALEDAGFTIREKCYHLFGSGMPKSLNVSKVLQAQGYDVEPGLGTGLKPSAEEWILARKPLAESSIAAQVLATGTGAINIDASRVGTHGNEPNARTNKHPSTSEHKAMFGNMKGIDQSWNGQQGRWPANLLLSHSVWCVPNGVKKVKGTAPRGKPSRGEDRPSNANVYGQLGPYQDVPTHYADSEGMEQVEDWLCTEDCPVRLLDEQSGHSVSKAGNRGRPFTSQGSHEGWKRPSHEHYTDGYSPISDQGGASRYFQRFAYVPKASRSERNRGCEGLPEKEGFDKNTSKMVRRSNPDTGEAHYNEYHPSSNRNSHPTVKPVNLMRYLVRMITPPGGICLDCFGGSGTTALACIAEGVDYLIIEQEQSYIEIAEARIQHALAEVA